ncbi:GTPase ObgE [Candidatus Parcubacteria bacterium]|nr:GTPase ObgE [Patescibacteria group bacterium]MBU4466504.1 GTPase ObgE [Patescibacteria group bacterium]MCG2688458.1 GTPase ObgE [Candidatus Parcubacteria bacterium]
MLIDDIKITVKAGKGGDGAVAFNKNRMSLGPTGADGGKGGSIYLEGISNLSSLNQFRYKKIVTAEDGKNGKGQFNDGRDADDLILRVPVGTVVYNLTTNEGQEIISLGQRLLIAKGGQGGKGNFKFRSSTNTTPKQFQEGAIGQEFELRLELKLIADVGLIGLPNVGKSSLLNELTNAKSKVANYPFTTLDPNLGTYYELILADIPGLIEGASTGKGLGIKFLRHVERTKTLFHLISAESTDLLKDYQTIRDELAAYNPKLLSKTEYVFLAKADLLKPEEAGEKLKQLKKANKQVMAISIIDEESLGLVKKILNQLIEEKH